MTAAGPDLSRLSEWWRPVVVPPPTRGEPVPAEVPAGSAEGKAGDGSREDGAAGDHPS